VSRHAWEVVGNVDASETWFTVRGLRAGTDYYFRVIAENGAGASPPLTLDRSFVPKTPYGQHLQCVCVCVCVSRDKLPLLDQFRFRFA